MWIKNWTIFNRNITTWKISTLKRVFKKIREKPKRREKTKKVTLKKSFNLYEDIAVKKFNGKIFEKNVFAVSKEEHYNNKLLDIFYKFCFNFLRRFGIEKCREKNEVSLEWI